MTLLERQWTQGDDETALHSKYWCCSSHCLLFSPLSFCIFFGMPCLPLTPPPLTPHSLLTHSLTHSPWICQHETGQTILLLLPFLVVQSSGLHGVQSSATKTVTTTLVNEVYHKFRFIPFRSISMQYGDLRSTGTIRWEAPAGCG
jgi:hypothetical protein